MADVVNNITIERVLSGGKTVGWNWDVWTNEGFAHGEAVNLFSAVESMREYLQYAEHIPRTSERLSSVELLQAALGPIVRTPNDP